MRCSILSTAATLAFSVYATEPEPVPGMNVIWSDDFSGSGNFDQSKWQYYSGSINNGEQETYPSSGDFCKLSGSDSLLITPTNNNGQWESCRIETIDSWEPPVDGKMQFQSRFKLGNPGASLQGIWPAFWALGDSIRHGTPWPQCGEIDTFENVNGQPLGHGTLHCGTTCKGSEGLEAGMAFEYGAFHTWSHIIDRSNGDWHEQSITWHLDGQPYHVIKGGDLNNLDDWVAVAQKAMFITLNVAVGGQWPGAVSPETTSGIDSGMEVQYVAVYSG